MRKAEVALGPRLDGALGAQGDGVIGDPQVFAVQLEWNRRPTYKPWMYGVFCVSICGELIGSPSNQATLNSILAGLDGWKETIELRRDPVLMAADPVTAFLSIENCRYGLEHLGDKIPPWFMPMSVSDLSAFEILNVDGLDDYRLYCVEDDTTSRLLYARMRELPRDCCVPRAVLTDVLNRTIERLDGWFAQLLEPPPGSD